MSMIEKDDAKFYVFVLLANYATAFYVHKKTVLGFQIFDIGFKGLKRLFEAGNYTDIVRTIFNPAIKGANSFMTTVIGLPAIIGYVLTFFLAIIYLTMFIDLIETIFVKYGRFRRERKFKKKYDREYEDWY